MIFRHEYRDGVWIDLEQPSQEEIREIAHECSIDERIEAELLSPTPRPLVSGDEHTALLILHFPTQNEKNNEIKNQEIDFIVGSRFIVTVRYEIVAPLYHLKKLLETQKLVGERTALTTDIFLEILFAHLYTSVRDHTNHLAENLARVEQHMFNGRERTTVRAISDISRAFLHVEAALANQEEPLIHFFAALAQRNFPGASFAERSKRILAERSHIAQLVKTHRAVASELRETNIALLEARQNEIMKTLTVITFSVLPLELIALVFGMHMLGTPLEQNPNAFWIIIAIMASIGGCMVLFFAKKRWIF